MTELLSGEFLSVFSTVTHRGDRLVQIRLPSCHQFSRNSCTYEAHARTCLSCTHSHSNTAREYSSHTKPTNAEKDRSSRHPIQPPTKANVHSFTSQVLGLSTESIDCDNSASIKPPWEKVRFEKQGKELIIQHSMKCARGPTQQSDSSCDHRKPRTRLVLHRPSAIAQAAK